MYDPVVSEGEDGSDIRSEDGSQVSESSGSVYEADSNDGVENVSLQQYLLQARS